MINDLWYKNAIVYCLSVGTYMDANGDGVGDFQGLLRRLDYLQGLGVTAIWLMPFQPSPGKDDGYDIADYYGVNPRYGTLGDFVEFTHGCKQRGNRRHSTKTVITNTSGTAAFRSGMVGTLRDVAWEASVPAWRTRHGHSANPAACEREHHRNVLH